MIISHEIAVYNDDALKKKFSSIQQTSDAITQTVSQKVGYNEIISSINQTAESIQISASKINLNGYATFSDLPTKTSDLTNDSSFATTSQIPTRTSQLTNNSGYVNSTQLATANQTVINGGNITTGIIKDAAGKFSLNMVTGAINMADGTFSGSITASSGSIGGYTIGSDYLYKGDTIGAANTFWLWPAGSDTGHKADIAGSGNVADWAMTISNNFGVRKNGTIHSASLVSKGTLRVFNQYDNLEMELNQNGMDIYDADDTSSNLLGKIGVNNYVGGARDLAVDMLGSNCSGFNITRRAYGSDEGKNLFQIEKDGTTAIHGDLTVDGSLTMGGSITVPSGQTIKGDLETRNSGGFIMDQYGNFRHKSTTTTNTWGIQKKDATAVFWVNYQTGETGIAGDLSVTGATTLTGALAARGGITIPSGQVASGYFEAPSPNAWTTGFEGNLTHKSTSSSATFGIYSKNGAKAVKITYESAAVTTDGPLTINGTLTGSTSEKVETTTYGIKTTLYKNAGTVTAYIHGTTTSELATSNGYIIRVMVPEGAAYRLSAVFA